MKPHDPAFISFVALAECDGHIAQLIINSSSSIYLPEIVERDKN